MIRTLGIILLALGLIGLIGGGVICLQLAHPQTGSPRALYYIAPLYLLLSALYFAPATIAGVGLLRSALWGRWMAWTVCGLLALSLPFGTPIGAFGIWALWRSRRETPPAGPVFPGRGGAFDSSGSLGMMVAIASVPAGFIVFLNLGFQLHGQITPPELVAVFWPGLIVLVLCVAYGASRLAKGWRENPRDLLPWRRRAAEGRERQTYDEALAARIADLSADPALSRYVQGLQKGETWSDAQILYDRDRAITGTCHHLEPVELDMRQAGLFLKLTTTARSVDAQCQIDRAAFEARYGTADIVYYEGFWSERALDDHPLANVNCRHCQSAIWTIPLILAREETAWFPAPRT